MQVIEAYSTIVTFAADEPSTMSGSARGSVSGSGDSAAAGVAGSANAGTAVAATTKAAARATRRIALAVEAIIVMVVPEAPLEAAKVNSGSRAKPQKQLPALDTRAPLL